jgi:hypothetical protein
MKRLNSQRGEVLIGFILVASIILALIYGIVDLARYTTMKSTVQAATMDVVQYAKSEDALLVSPYDPANAAMPKYLRARQALTRVFNTNPLLQQTSAQLTPIKVAHYGNASGPEVMADIPEYVAYLPPGTSAQFIFPGETRPQWIHHSVCCDPTVQECPEAQRRTSSTNPCNGVEYEKLLGKFPTEFVSATVVKNSQIFSSNVITRSSGFPRVQLVAAVTTTSTTTTTTLQNICIRVDPPIVSSRCTFDHNTKKFITTTVSDNKCDPAISSTAHSNPQERCDPKVGVLYYLDNREDCTPVIKTEIPRIDPAFNCSIDSTGKILTATTNSINPATCALMTGTETRVRPPAVCAEHDGALWHHTHDRNLLTCDWDINTNNKVQNKPSLFCGINPETNRYEIRNYVPDFSTCTYQLSTEPIATREVQCSIDPSTGEGRETNYTFSEAACQFVANSTVTKPRPTATCIETTNGVRATFTNYHDFVRDGASCQWRANVSEVLAPGKTCTERLNPTTNTYEAVKGTPVLHVDIGVSPAICNYNAAESVSQKPADSACVADGNLFSKTTYSFNNNPDSCGYTPTKVPCDKIDCVVSDWTGTVPTACGQSYTMTRTIITPPQNGGNACPALTEVRTTEPCIKVDCQVSDWTGTVPTTCGQTYTMTRTVLTPPQHGGNACPALSEERSTDPCIKVDCQVSDWEGTVPTTCGQTYTMTRRITVPALNGGTECPALTEVRNTAACEKQCVWVAAWANCSGIYCSTRDGWGVDLVDGSRAINYDRRESIPSCFAEKFSPLCPGSSHSAGITTYGGCAGGKNYITMGWSVGYYFSPGDLADFLGVTQEYRDNMNYSVNGDIRNGAEGTNALGIREPVTWYMDRNCRFVPPNDNQMVCGFAGVSWSPISLVLDESSSINQNMTVVPFSIDPHQPKAYSLWKASDKAPLLVYDPDNSGKISSARQLFGDYAFGGRTTQPSNYQVAQLREPWSNGYEALSLLDHNNDAELSGDELVALKLWFDTNKDGIADLGELRELKQEGVSKLFYKNPQNIIDSQDLEIRVGFERYVDGKIVTGRSVDWYSKTYTSKQEAADAVKAELSRYGSPTNPKIDTYVLPVELSGPPGRFKPHIASNHREDLSGYWIWSTKDNQGAMHPGVFAIEQNGDKIYGYSVVETTLEKNSGGINSAIALYPLEGKVVRNGNELKTIEFTVHDPSGAGEARTSGTIVTSGEAILGSTSQMFSVTRDTFTRSASVNYEWVARKFVANPTTTK